MHGLEYNVSGNPPNLNLLALVSSISLRTHISDRPGSPFITTSGFGHHFRGHRVIDGGATNNIPVFTDSARRQLMFDLSRVSYAFEWTMSPSDPCIGNP